MTVGIATRSPKARVVPSWACTAAMAINGPGCGGIKPCRTDNPANAGIATRISFSSERCVTSTITGSNSTRPISKNIGRPMMIATSAIAHGTIALDAFDSSVSITRSAPPESASSLPSIAPRAISSPTSFRVSPTPSSKLDTTIGSATGAASPTNAEPRTSARNGCILSTTISSTMIAMPITVTTIRRVSCAAHGLVTAAAAARVGFIGSRSPGSTPLGPDRGRS